MDRELMLLKGSVDQEAEQTMVIKLLFRPGSRSDGAPDDSVQVVEVAGDVLRAGLHLLEASTQGFPASVRLVRGYQAGYLPSLARPPG
jgi:hypothetical protein